jgi:hypothetical protein
MSSAEYHEYQPRADLAGIINCLWTFDGDDAVADQPVVPDGRCELVVHCAEPYREYLTNSAVTLRQSPILFAGQITQPLTLRASGPVSVIAVRFFRRFTGLPPSAFLAAGPGLARSLVNL